MLIIGILLIIIGIYIHKFLNKPEPHTPAIAVYELAHAVPVIFILVGIILLIIGLIKAI